MLHMLRKLRKLVAPVNQVAPMAPVAPAVGDFSFIHDSKLRDECKDAWAAVTAKPKYKEYILTKDPKASWVYTNNETALEIIHSLKLIDKHTGCSVACIMRAMEYILKNEHGWERFVEQVKKHEQIGNGCNPFLNWSFYRPLLNRYRSLRVK